jgi:hypothetical protein
LEELQEDEKWEKKQLAVPFGLSLLYRPNEDEN